MDCIATIDNGKGMYMYTIAEGVAFRENSFQVFMQLTITIKQLKFLTC